MALSLDSLYHYYCLTPTWFYAARMKQGLGIAVALGILALSEQNVFTGRNVELKPE
eukprot:GDKH01022762.1.p1 GENE.GDKH01022762.1~~GDKH01022762.1.p1  ORF type:complete len:56 (+),score=3.01 GDKH01022762.1:3-170(+)